MKRMSDKTRRIIFWTMFACTTLLLIAAFAIGLVGIHGSNSSLIRIANILIPCGLLLNVINVFVFKPSGKKSKKGYKEEPKK